MNKKTLQIIAARKHDAPGIKGYLLL